MNTTTRNGADLVAQIQDLCRETGYVTHGQAREIAHKIAAALAPFPQGGVPSEPVGVVYEQKGIPTMLSDGRVVQQPDYMAAMWLKGTPANGTLLYDRATPASTTSEAQEAAERTPKDFAIEHAEYMATGAEHLLTQVNDMRAAGRSSREEAEQDVFEAASKLHGLIYEFRKRRDAARLSPPAEGGTDRIAAMRSALRAISESYDDSELRQRAAEALAADGSAP